MRRVVPVAVTLFLVLVALPAVAVAARTAVTVAVTYTAIDGRSHPSRAIRVEVRDADGTTSGTVLATALTNDAGIATFSVTTRRADGTARQVFARALSSGTGFTVHPVDLLAPYPLASSPATATGTAQRVELHAGRVADDETAFAVADAMVTGVRYGTRVNGGTPLPAVAVSFPDPAGTVADGATIRLRHSDRFDWDVTLHEYGNVAARQLAIVAGPGGPHGFGRNLAEPPSSKLAGVRLAWSEGFATWFALTAEDVLGAAALGIPTVGDANYDDQEEPGPRFLVPIGTDAMISGVGEDDELSIARTLWHLRSDAATHLDDRTMISALRTAHATTLSAAVAALLPAAGGAPFDGSGHPSAAQLARSNDVACILTRQNVAPLLTAPGDGATVSVTEPPTFTWEPRGAGPSHRLDHAVVQVWSADWSTLRLTSASLTGTTFTPTHAQWAGVVKPTDGSVHVVVRGRNADAPATGPYDGCAADVAPGGDLTATPMTTTFHPPAVNASCAGMTVPQDSMLTVAGSHLTPSARYDIVLHAEHGGAPDSTLATATTSRSGVVPATLAILPGVPTGRSWVVLARPRHAGDIAASVSRPVGWITCWRGNPTGSGTDVVWGGAGAVRGTTVTELAGTTPVTAVADATGNYVGSYTTRCGGAVHVPVWFTGLDGPVTGGVDVVCPAARRGRGPSVGWSVGSAAGPA